MEGGEEAVEEDLEAEAGVVVVAEGEEEGFGEIVTVIGYAVTEITEEMITDDHIDRGHRDHVTLDGGHGPVPGRDMIPTEARANAEDLMKEGP